MLSCHMGWSNFGVHDLEMTVLEVCNNIGRTCFFKNYYYCYYHPPLRTCFSIAERERDERKISIGYFLLCSLTRNQTHNFFWSIGRRSNQRSQAGQRQNLVILELKLEIFVRWHWRAQRFWISVPSGPHTESGASALRVEALRMGSLGHRDGVGKT